MLKFVAKSLTLSLFVSQTTPAPLKEKSTAPPSPSPSKGISPDLTTYLPPDLTIAPFLPADIECIQESPEYIPMGNISSVKNWALEKSSANFEYNNETTSCIAIEISAWGFEIVPKNVFFMGNYNPIKGEFDTHEKLVIGFPPSKELIQTTPPKWDVRLGEFTTAELPDTDEWKLVVFKNPDEINFAKSVQNSIEQIKPVRGFTPKSDTTKTTTSTTKQLETFKTPNLEIFYILGSTSAVISFFLLVFMLCKRLPDIEG